MNTLPDISRPTTGASHTDALLLRAVANMRPGWIVLCDCGVGADEAGVEARVRYALLHPRIGIALLDVLPGTTTHGAPDRLRRLMEASNFHAAFGGCPPIVYLCVPSHALSGLGLLLISEFNLLPALALAGGDAWVGAARRLFAAEPPSRQPGRTAVSGRPHPPWTPEPAEMGQWNEPRSGLRGLAVFWGVVAVVFGGGALVLQHLGPPDQPPAAAHASSAGPDEARAAQAWSEARQALSHPDRPQMLSPSPVLAMWPAERMQTPFDQARAGADLRDTSDLASADPTAARTETHSIYAARETTVARADVGKAEGVPGTAMVAGVAAPAETAGIPASPAPSHPSLVPGVPTPARGDSGGGTDAVFRRAFGTGGGAGASPSGDGPNAAESGAAAAEWLAFNWFARRTLTGSPPPDGLGTPADALPSSVDSPSFEGASTTPPSAASGEPTRTDASAALGLDGNASTAADTSPAALSPLEIEALVAAIADKIVSSNEEAFRSAPTAGGMPDPEAESGVDNAASAAGVAGSDDPRPPEVGAAEPAPAPVQAAVPSGAAEFPPVADPRSPVRAGPGNSLARGDHQGADRQPSPERAETAAVEGTAMPGAPQPVSKPLTARPTVPVPGFPSAPAAQVTVPPADPEPASSKAASATVHGEAAPVADAPKAEAGGTVLDAGPAPEAGRIAAAPLPHPAPQGGEPGLPDAGTPPLPGVRVEAPLSPSVETAVRAEPAPVPVARPGAAPDIDPAAPRPERSQTAAMSGPPRPSAPELGGGATTRAANTTVGRAPAAPERSALVESLIARGDAMVARRDISAARLLYERAAATDPRAAAGLAKTYDPAFLAEIGAHGIRGDAALAADWYRKAASLGDGAAAAKLEALNASGQASHK